MRLGPYWRLCCVVTTATAVACSPQRDFERSKDDAGGTSGAVEGDDGTEDAGADDGSNEDQSAPRLLKTVPSDGATKVDDQELLVLEFDKAMDKLSTGSAISVTRSDGSDSPSVSLTIESVTWDLPGKTATIIVDSIEAREATSAEVPPYEYTVSISNIAADTSGNYLVDTSFTFATIRHVTQTIEPTVHAYISQDSADTSKYGVSGAVAAVGCFVASPRRLGRAYVAFPIGPDVIPAGVKLTSARIDFSLQAMPEGTATVEVWNSIGSVFAGAYAIEVPTVPNDNAYNPPADSPDWGETFANEGSGFSTGDAFLTYLDAKLAHLEDDDRIEVQLRAANATVASKCKDTEHRFHLDGTALVVAYSW